MSTARRLLWLALLGLAILVLVKWLQRGPMLQPLVINGQALGASYRFTVVAPQTEKTDTDQLQQQLHEVLASVESALAMDNPNSELARFNAKRSTEPMVLSKDMARVISEAIRIGAMSNNALDITVGPLVELWQFDPNGQLVKAPDEQAIKQAKKRVGLNYLHLDGYRVHKEIPDLFLDLSALAKGFAIDQVAAFLDGQGYDNYQLEMGSEWRAKGVNAQQQPWRITLPVAQDKTQDIYPKNLAVATSGRTFSDNKQAGFHYSHTINPQTAQMIDQRLVSVSVLHSSGLTADGLATALHVMGPEQGMKLAEQLQLPVLMVIETDNGYTERMSSTFEPYLRPDKGK